MPEVRIKEDTLWYGCSYKRGEVTVVEGAEYLDLLMAGRVETTKPGCKRKPAVLADGEIEGRHSGELVFVLGNGPSLALAKPHISSLARFATVGVNRSFLMLETTYLLFLDAVMWVRESRELMESRSLVLCPKRLRLPCFTQFGRYFKHVSESVLSERWEDGLYWSRSSGVAAVNLAYLFGASEIALLGIDLNDNSHFYSEHGRGQGFPHAARIIEDLYLMSREMKKRGMKLWNCSPNSSVRGFEKVKLEKLLERR